LYLLCNPAKENPKHDSKIKNWKTSTQRREAGICRWEKCVW